MHLYRRLLYFYLAAITDVVISTPFACLEENGESDLSTGCLSALAQDSAVASEVLFEDAFSKVWNMTLLPGEMSSMHKHCYDYTFVVQETTKLSAWDERGKLLFTFEPTGSNSFVCRDELVPVLGSRLPCLPRTYAVKNIGQGVFREIVVEHKAVTNKTDTQRANLELALTSEEALVTEESLLRRTASPQEENIGERANASIKVPFWSRG